MASHITQITRYSAALGQTIDVTGALKALERADGWIGSYNGAQISDPGVGFWIFDWESAAHRTDFLTDPAHGSILSALRSLAVTENKTSPYSFQVQLDPPHAPSAFKAPVTEISTGTLRDNAEVAVYEALMLRVVDAMGRAKGACGTAWGKVAGEGCNGMYVLVTGWESVEAQQDALAAGAVHELNEQISSMADYEIRLVKLEQYEKGSVA